MIFELVSRTVTLSSADHLNCFYGGLGVQIWRGVSRRFDAVVCLRGPPGVPAAPRCAAQHRVRLRGCAQGAHGGVLGLCAAGDREVTYASPSRQEESHVIV